MQIVVIEVFKMYIILPRNAPVLYLRLSSRYNWHTKKVTKDLREDPSIQDTKEDSLTDDLKRTLSLKALKTALRKGS